MKFIFSLIGVLSFCVTALAQTTPESAAAGTTAPSTPETQSTPANEPSDAQMATQIQSPEGTKTPPPVKNFATRDLITSEKKPLKTSFFSLASVRTMDAEKGGASWGSYNYIGVSKKLTSESQLGFRYVFFYDTPGTKFNPAKRREEQVTHQTEVGDPYVSYSHYSLWRNNEWNLSGSGRIYAPLSRYSQASRMITQFRTEFFLDRPMMKYSNFNYSVKTDYFVQSQKAMLDDETPRRYDGSIDRYAVKGNKIAQIEHYIEIDGNLHKKFSIKPRVAFEDSWYYGSDENGIDGRHDSDFKLQLGAEYRVLRNLSFMPALEERTPVANQKEPFQLGRAENYKWMLLTYASF